MVYFISDVHLGLGSPDECREREHLLLRFLETCERDARTLVIVGDLFDYWFEYRTVIPRPFFRVLTKLDSMRRAGVEIEYLMGNHDFGHQDFFEKELGIRVHTTDIERVYHGKRFYLAHGDGKVHNDTGYLLLRPVLRSPVSIKLFQWLHPDLGIRLASSTSSTSRVHSDKRPMGPRDGLAEFAETKIDEGFDYVIMGHVHSPLVRTFTMASHAGTYLNLGEWMRHRTFARFDGESCTLENLAAFIGDT
ncbi:MAG: UDP-2,3-diacylglucosamine diphosphatase [Candidatus Kapaibacterium sp.]